LTDSILQKDDRRIAIDLIVLMDSGDEDGCKGCEEVVEMHHVEAREFRFASRLRASFNASVNIITQQHSTPFASKSLLFAAMIQVLTLYLVPSVRREDPIPVRREGKSFVGNTRTESNIKGGKPRTDYI
jgi:hypothetical protein